MSIAQKYRVIAELACILQWYYLQQVSLEKSQILKLKHILEIILIPAFSR